MRIFGSKPRPAAGRKPSAPLETGAVAAEVRSASWDPGVAELSVGIPTHGHPEFLAELVVALERQTFDLRRFEVIVVDDASPGQTWQTVEAIAAATPLRLLGLRLGSNGGPALARNTAAAAARAPTLVFVDDDCLPQPGWLEAYANAFNGGADLVQGRTIAQPESWTGPWERSVWVTGESWLFESCNIGYKRSSFVSLAGFDAARPAVIGRTRPHFGEDAELGWRFRAAGLRTTFEPEALVYHRNIPGTYLEWLREMRRRVLFPRLVRRSPGMARALFLGIFLSRDSAAFDLAFASVAAAAATSTPLFVVGAIPWAMIRWRGARHRPGRPRIARVGQLAVGDVVSLLSLIEGSLRAGRIVL